MLEDPIIIRKAKDNYIISATLKNEPVQLIRQLDAEHLEVHLKGGITYVETVTPADREQVVLELMGFRHEELVINFRTWLYSQDDLIDFKPLKKLSAKLKKELGDKLIGMLYYPTPYISSKFISLSLVSVDEEIRECYDYEYGSYEVDMRLKFWCRVDHLSEVIDWAWENKHDFTHQIMRYVTKETVGCADANFSFITQD